MSKTGGLYFDKSGNFNGRKRLVSDEAPESNLCKTTCIDRGDIFCVNKKDLISDPVCCPRKCNDPNKGGVNECAEALR